MNLDQKMRYILAKSFGNIMKTEIVYWSVGDSPLKTPPLTAVIGNFDGVHLGHQKLISTAKNLQKIMGLNRCYYL